MSRSSSWLSHFISGWENPEIKTKKLIDYARDNNGLQCYQNGVTGSIDLQIQPPSNGVVFEGYNGSLPPVEVSGIGMAAIRRGHTPYRIRVDEANPGKSIAGFVKRLNEERGKNGLKPLFPTFQKSLLSAPKSLGKERGFTNGIFFLGQDDIWTNAIRKNKYIAKGMIWFVSCEAERNAYKKWAEMLCNWSIDNDEDIVDKGAAKKIAALMIKKADFLTDMDTIKGPFYEGESPKWKDIIKSDPKMVEYLGFRTIAVLKDREYKMFPIPTDAIEHFYGVESVFQNSMVCIKKGLIPKFAEAYWSARKNELPKKLQKKLVYSFSHYIVPGDDICGMIDAIAGLLKINPAEVFDYIRGCGPFANTMGICEVIRTVYEKEMKTAVHEMASRWFENEIRTSATQFVMYNVHPDGDGVFAGNLYLRDVASTKGSPSISPQWIGRNTWTEESEAAFLARAESVKETLLDRKSLAAAASENSDATDFVPDWARVALNYGHTYQMVGAALHVLNRLNEWDGVKGPELPAILYDVETNSIIVDVESDMVYLHQNARVRDFGSCVHGGDPVIEENETINGFLYRVPGNHVRAIRRSISAIVRAHDDCDGDYAKAIIARQIVNGLPYHLQVVESSAGSRVGKPDKSLTPGLPDVKEGENKEEYLHRVFSLHCERVCNVSVARSGVAGWDTLFSALGNVGPASREAVESIIGFRLQGAVDIKVQPDYGFFTEDNIVEALGDLHLYNDDLMNIMGGGSKSNNPIGGLIGLGSQISKVVGGHKVLSNSYMNEDLARIKYRLLSEKGADGRAIFDNLYGIFGMIESGKDLIRRKASWSNGLVRDFIHALTSGISMNYSVKASETLALPLIKRDFYGWKWFKGFKEITNDKKLLSFVQYLPAAIIEAVKSADKEKWAERILAIRDALSHIANLIVERTGSDIEYVRFLLAWGLFEESMKPSSKGYRYLSIALMKDQVLNLAEIVDARFSLFQEDV